ncbi:AAA family ATPase [endosymbiont GvMRE of Glomus versiforme]|uniref:AAA family ATPase n=1 Tax=endosymbiont GvMRE of Glomus versiforme TaxID=2039283 RepID=UPI001558E0C2|nr:ATP-binding protein [endosymbiont GvMRE of Glomus versiforme]
MATSISNTNTKIRQLKKQLGIKDDYSSPIEIEIGNLGYKFIFPKKKDQRSNWTDEIYQKSIRDKIKKKINYFKFIGNFLNEKASHTNKNMLFFGPPGSGKSYYAEILAKNESSAYTIISAGELQQYFVGSGGSKWKQIFEMAKILANNLPANSKPIIIVIDEFDSLAGKGKNNPFNSKDDTLVNTLLTTMDEVHRSKLNIWVVATTNYYDMLEDASVRSGRFDTKIKIRNPRDQKEYSELSSKLKHLVENEKKEIEISVDFWEKAKESVWNIASSDKTFLKKSGFSILSLRSKIHEIFADKIHDKLKKIFVGVDDIPKFEESLKDEIKLLIKWQKNALKE